MAFEVFRKRLWLFTAVSFSLLIYLFGLLAVRSWSSGVIWFGRRRHEPICSKAICPHSVELHVLFYTMFSTYTAVYRHVQRVQLYILNIVSVTIILDINSYVFF